MMFGASKAMLSRVHSSFGPQTARPAGPFALTRRGKWGLITSNSSEIHRHGFIIIDLVVRRLSNILFSLHLVLVRQQLRIVVWGRCMILLKQH